MRALVCPLLDRLSWVLAATVVAGTRGDGASLASVRWVGLGSASHGGYVHEIEGASLMSFGFFGVGTASHSAGGHDRRGRCSGLCSTERRRISRPLCWRARMLRALLYPLFARSAWAHAATVLADTTVEGVALASVRSVGVGSAGHYDSGHER